MGGRNKSFGDLLRESIAGGFDAVVEGVRRMREEDRRLAEHIGDGANDPGAVVYYPEPDADLSHPIHSRSVVDARSGWRLDSTYDLPRLDGSSRLQGWKISAARGRTVLLFTTVRSDGYRPGYGKTEALTVVLAHPDSFFPFDEAVYQGDVPFARIAQMLSAYYMRWGPILVIDNRETHRAENQRRAAERSRESFQIANHAVNPALHPGARVIYPTSDTRIHFDAESSTAVDRGDGSTFKVTRREIREYPRWEGEWYDAGSGRTARVIAIPMRGYKPGYGETFTLEVTMVALEYARDGRWVREVISREEMPPERLARLLNHFEAATLSGRHTGNLVVIDTRTHEADRYY